MDSHESPNAVDCSLLEEQMGNGKLERLLSTGEPKDADFQEDVGGTKELSNSSAEEMAMIPQGSKLLESSKNFEKIKLQGILKCQDRVILGLRKQLYFRTGHMKKAQKGRAEDKKKIDELESQIANLKIKALEHEQQEAYISECNIALEHELHDALQQLEDANWQSAEVSGQARQAEKEYAEREFDYKNVIKELESSIRLLKIQARELHANLAIQEGLAAQMQQIANPNKISDDTIVRIWEKLRYNVHVIAENVLIGDTSKERLDALLADQHNMLRRMSYRDTALLQTEDFKPSVIEKYLWRMIAGRFFGRDNHGKYGRCWGGTVGQSLCTSFNEFISVFGTKNPRTADLLRWKADGGRLIKDVIGIDQNELDKAVDAETKSFSIFLPAGELDGNGLQKLSASLNKTFRDALQLQTFFMTSKANFSLFFPRERRSTGVTPFNPERMEAEIWEKEPLDKNSIVQLIISPGLMKAGTADGEDYDQRLLLTPARVVCN